MEIFSLFGLSSRGFDEYWLHEMLIEAGIVVLHFSHPKKNVRDLNTDDYCFTSTSLLRFTALTVLSLLRRQSTRTTSRRSRSRSPRRSQSTSRRSPPRRTRTPVRRFVFCVWLVVPRHAWLLSTQRQLPPNAGRPLIGPVDRLWHHAASMCVVILKLQSRAIHQQST